MSTAIFLTDQEDKHVVEQVLGQQQTTYSAMIRSKPDWVLSRVQRYVPPPEILYSRVASVLKTYGLLKDARTGEPLFNNKAQDVMKTSLSTSVGGTIQIHQTWHCILQSERTTMALLYTTVAMEPMMWKVEFIRT